MLTLSHDLLRTLRILTGRVIPAIHALISWRQKLKGCEVAVINGQALNRLRLESRRNVRLFRLQLGHLARDFHGLLYVTNLQLGIDASGSINLYQHAWDVVSFESGSFDVNLIGIGN